VKAAAHSARRNHIAIFIAVRRHSTPEHANDGRFGIQLRDAVLTMIAGGKVRRLAQSCTDEPEDQPNFPRFADLVKSSRP